MIDNLPYEKAFEEGCDAAVVVIRHRLPCPFTERRWSVLRPIMDLGRLRAREVVLGETHPETEVRGDGGLAAVLSRALLAGAAWFGG